MSSKNYFWHPFFNSQQSEQLNEQKKIIVDSENTILTLNQTVVDLKEWVFNVKKFNLNFFFILLIRYRKIDLIEKEKNYLTLKNARQVDEVNSEIKRLQNNSVKQEEITNNHIE